jgi:hypothetical protein
MHKQACISSLLQPHTHPAPSAPLHHPSAPWSKVPNIPLSICTLTWLYTAQTSSCPSFCYHRKEAEVHTIVGPPSPLPPHLCIQPTAYQKCAGKDWVCTEHRRVQLFSDHYFLMQHNNHLLNVYLVRSGLSHPRCFTESTEEPYK